MYASGGLCKSSVQAAYRIGCHLLRLVCSSGLCQQSHVLALSLLLVVAGDVETNPGPLDGRCAIYMLYTTCMMELDHTSGVAKAGPGWARARPKHHIRPTHVNSCHRHKANGLVYSRCPANTNDLATPLNEACLKVCVCCCYITSKPGFFFRRFMHVKNLTPT